MNSSKTKKCERFPAPSSGEGNTFTLQLWLGYRTHHIDRIFNTLLILPVLLFLASQAGRAEHLPGDTLSLNQCVELALHNYPSIREKMARVGAAQSGVGLAATAYIPRLDLLWQEIRSTRNNVAGTLLPQSVVPSMSGGVRSSDHSESLWGSAGGVLLSWELFDFGLRAANIQAAAAAVNHANANLQLTQLEVAATAADAVIALLAAEQSEKAAQANLKRAHVLSSSVHLLVENDLRPGADATRADAQIAMASTVLIQAQQTLEMGRATLAEVLGLAGRQLTITADALLELPPQNLPLISNIASHPAVRAQSSAIETVRARQRALDSSDVPRINLQSSFSMRGTGADADGIVEGGSEGLLPETPNWAVGVSVTYPFSEKFSIQARRRIEEQNAMAERARHDQIVQGLIGQSERARVALESAFKIAQNTPIQLRAAQDSEAQARARYEALLASLTELADAQRLLTQAEIDNSLARLNIWRALLYAAKANGDIHPFLQLTDWVPVGEGY